jgi:hypothetical protein
MTFTPHHPLQRRLDRWSYQQRPPVESGAFDQLKTFSVVDVSGGSC